VQRVIAQTRMHVLEGQKVASEEKVLSLFEPHMLVIPCHKGGADVEFGRLVTRFEISSPANTGRWKRRWCTISVSLDTPHASWQMIVGSARPRPGTRWRKQASRPSLFPLSARSQANDKPWSVPAAFAEGIGGDGASRNASTACDEIMDCGAVGKASLDLCHSC
jgi:hypothetical protein